MLWWIIGGPRCTIRCRPPVAAADDAIADLDLDQKPDRLLRVFIERTPERTICRLVVKEPEPREPFIWRSGLFAPDDLQELREFWSETCDLLERYTPNDWSSVVEAMKKWLWPSVSSTVNVDVPSQFLRCGDLHFGFAGVRCPDFTRGSNCPKFLPSRWMRHKSPVEFTASLELKSLPVASVCSMAGI
jgi:hypothetical protein